MVKKYKGIHKPDYSKEYLDALEIKEAEKKVFKQDMRTIKVSSADKNELGMLSSGWDEYSRSKLKDFFQKARNAGYTRANDIASFWNDIGFKTGSGNSWTPRLVNIAKDIRGIKHGSKVIY